MARLKGVVTLSIHRHPTIWFLVTLVILAVFTALGPAEKSLGTHVRVVYLHGVWVWASLAAFLLSGIAGLVGLALRREDFHLWSRALGRTGLIFWVTYLPISLWAMQANWNGLFLAEPRWRMALIFAVCGLVMQIGLVLVEDSAWASAVNFLFSISLFFALSVTQEVMHPPSPILSSDAWRIQLYFGGLLSLTLFAAWQIARWWYGVDNLSRVKV